MDDIERMPERQAFWFGWGLATLAVATVLVLFTLAGSVHVTKVPQQSSLTYGWPLGWLTQDQSSADPPLPFDLVVGSPQEFPTKIRWSAFLVDLAVFWLPLLAAVYYVRRAKVRRAAVEDRAAGVA